MRLAGCLQCHWTKMLLDEVGNENENLRSLNFQLKICIPDLKASMSSFKKNFISFRCRAKMLKTRPRISSSTLLDYNATWCNYYNTNWIPSFMEYLLLKWEYWWEGMGLWKLGRGCVGRPWWSQRHRIPKFWWNFFPSWMVSLYLLRGLTLHCLRKTALAFPEAVLLQDTAVSPQDPL